MMAADQNSTFPLLEVARIDFVRRGEGMTEAMSLTCMQFMAAGQVCIRFASQYPGLYRLMFSSDAGKTIAPVT
ncbi:hypothetical protein KOEU_33120 [Komagataeibacter europaeus]|uniref:Uncharacterized protein n=1 Tax=Komagataeibacter europaeus TaxID=33995 RepID=A0A0M0ED74_KOMEU|nr:Transcriptional regulator [Komagataeibacter xylinus E25]KON63188.1 hypothetical protein KOEU_33120 [Komagataeibacter europaeus]